MCMEYLRCLCEPEGEELLDSSVAVDLSKIHGILSLGDITFVQDVVSRCLKGQSISYTELSKTINLTQNDRLSNTDILTTLLSMGYLTYEVNHSSVPTRRFWSNSSGTTSSTCPNSMRWVLIRRCWQEHPRPLPPAIPNPSCGTWKRLCRQASGSIAACT